MTFELTDAGRAAITDAANRRTNRVVFTRMAVGDGLALSGVGDGGRASLRNERQREDLTSVAGGVARIGVRVSFTGMVGAQAWNVTEVGLIAQVAGGVEFLAAYGAVEAGADPYAVIAPGVSAVIAATVVVVASEAAVAVTVAPSVAVEGASTFAALLDTPAALTPLAYYRGAADGMTLEARSAAQLAGEFVQHLHYASGGAQGDLVSGAIAVPAGWSLTLAIAATIGASLTVSVLRDGVKLSPELFASFATPGTGLQRAGLWRDNVASGQYSLGARVQQAGFSARLIATPPAAA